MAEVRDLGTDKQHRRGILARCHAGTAANTGGRIEGGIRIRLGNQCCIRINRRTGAHIHIPPRGDDAIKGTAVDHQVANHRKRIGAKRLDPDGVAIGKFTHVQLAGRHAALLAVRDAVDRERARPANAFAAIVIKMNRLLVFFDEPLVDDVEHLKKRGFGGDVWRIVSLYSALGVGPGLPPNFQCQVHWKISGEKSVHGLPYACRTTPKSNHPLPRG